MLITNFNCNECSYHQNFIDKFESINSRSIRKINCEKYNISILTSTKDGKLNEFIVSLYCNDCDCPNKKRNVGLNEGEISINCLKCNSKEVNINYFCLFKENKIKTPNIDLVKTKKPDDDEKYIIFFVANWDKKEIKLECSKNQCIKDYLIEIKNILNITCDCSFYHNCNELNINKNFNELNIPSNNKIQILKET